MGDRGGLWMEIEDNSRDLRGETVLGVLVSVYCS